VLYEDVIHKVALKEKIVAVSKFCQVGKKIYKNKIL